MKKQILILLISLFSVGFITESIAQNTSEELYLPLEFRQAYEHGTRDKSGRVADGYWQNSAKYDIDASIKAP